MEIAAVIVSVLALCVSGTISLRALRISRHQNETRILIDLFTEHRSPHLAEARVFVHDQLRLFNPAQGFEAIPPDKRNMVRDLGWFYDNLGVLVHHDVVDLAPISGYLGGSVLDIWPKMKPFVLAEREKRRIAGTTDPTRWQAYFEMLHDRISKHPPEQARS
ncbi:hypothetical protein ACFWFQ_15770 [Nocardia salmonicida]|uniref:DUF4760 domain-containing protein n=1 Tax=Nocardia salmonicida TaxID=53431 RepID=UPI00365661D6